MLLVEMTVILILVHPMSTAARGPPRSLLTAVLLADLRRFEGSSDVLRQQVVLALPSPSVRRLVSALCPGQSVEQVRMQLETASSELKLIRTAISKDDIEVSAHERAAGFRDAGLRAAHPHAC